MCAVFSACRSSLVSKGFFKVSNRTLVPEEEALPAASSACVAPPPSCESPVLPLLAHIVVVMDHSASMRRADCEGSSRLSAAYCALTQDLLSQQLESACLNRGRLTLSLIAVATEPTLVLERAPLDARALWRVAEVGRTARAGGHGNVLPAFDLVERILRDEEEDETCRGTHAVRGAASLKQTGDAIDQNYTCLVFESGLLSRRAVWALESVRTERHLKSRPV